MRVGDFIELEMSGLTLNKERIEISNPRIIDSANTPVPEESNELLIDNQTDVNYSQTYSAFLIPDNNLLLKFKENGCE